MAQGNTAVPQHGDHDRVAMLSLKADGTPDQTNPEIIGNREFAEAATIEQFKQQAVSAVDQIERDKPAEAAEVEDLGEDPSIAELQSKHEDAATAAEAAAVKTVGELFTGDDQADAGKSTTPAKPSSASGKSDSGK